MSKPKKKRTKKYQPGRATIPTWVYDLWGPLTEENYQTFEAAVRTDLSLIKMGTWDGSRYGDLLFALRRAAERHDRTLSLDRRKDPGHQENEGRKDLLPRDALSGKRPCTAGST